MRFDGGHVTGIGGVLLLHHADQMLDLLEAAAVGLPDGRQPGKVLHRQVALLRQRVFGLTLGY